MNRNEAQLKREAQVERVVTLIEQMKDNFIEHDIKTNTNLQAGFELAERMTSKAFMLNMGKEISDYQALVKISELIQLAKPTMIDPKSGEIVGNLVLVTAMRTGALQYREQQGIDMIEDWIEDGVSREVYWMDDDMARLLKYYDHENQKCIEYELAVNHTHRKLQAMADSIPKVDQDQMPIESIYDRVILIALNSTHEAGMSISEYVELFLLKVLLVTDFNAYNKTRKGANE